MYDRKSYQRELKLTNPTSMTKEEKEALEAKEIEGEKDNYKRIINKIFDSSKKYTFKDFPIKLDTTFRYPQEVADISKDFCLLHEKQTNTFYLLPIEDYKVVVESYNFIKELKGISTLSILSYLMDTPNPYIDYKDKENMVKTIKKWNLLALCAFFGGMFSLLFGAIALPIIFNSFSLGSFGSCALVVTFFAVGLPITSAIYITKYEDKAEGEYRNNIQYKGVYIFPSAVYCKRMIS